MLTTDQAARLPGPVGPETCLDVATCNLQPSIPGHGSLLVQHQVEPFYYCGIYQPVRKGQVVMLHTGPWLSLLAQLSHTGTVGKCCAQPGACCPLPERLTLVQQRNAPGQAGGRMEKESHEPISFCDTYLYLAQISLLPLPPAQPRTFLWQHIRNPSTRRNMCVGPPDPGRTFTSLVPTAQPFEPSYTPPPDVLRLV